MIDESLADILAEIRDDAYEAPPDTHLADVPVFTDVTPDGKEVVVYGDVPGDRQIMQHEQGKNEYDFEGDCGLVSSMNVLREFGVEVDENQIVRQAIAGGECDFKPGHPLDCGGSDGPRLAQLLTDMGVHAHADTDQSLESLAERVETGHGTIVGVNCGRLWDDSRSLEGGGANHAIVVTGVARDPATGEVAGFYVNDSGRGLSTDAGRFVSAELMEKCYIETGGQCVVTDDPRPTADASAPIA